MVHVGNTTYTADNHPNNTKPKHWNSMDLIDAKTQATHKNMKQTLDRKGRSIVLKRSATDN